MRIICLLLISFHLFPEIKSFGFFIGSNDQDINNNLSTLKKYDLIIVDGDQISNKTIKKLLPTKVIAYLSVGTIEKYRTWYKEVKKYKLDYWEEWDEWYANVNNQNFRNFITKKMIPRYLNKGFSGIFFDNFDMIETYPKQKIGMLKLFKNSYQYLKRKNKLLITQNGSSQIKLFTKYIDMWNQEGVLYDYDFKSKNYVNNNIDNLLETISFLKNKGKFVLLTSYNNESNLTEDITKELCLLDGLPFISDINLNQIKEPLKCQ